MNARQDDVGVLNQYMSGYQPLTVSRRRKAQISEQVQAINENFQNHKNEPDQYHLDMHQRNIEGLETEGYLLEKDIIYPDSDRYNLLILPQRFKDSWTPETLHYTLLFNSLHLNRLIF